MDNSRRIRGGDLSGTGADWIDCHGCLQSLRTKRRMV